MTSSTLPQITRDDLTKCHLQMLAHLNIGSKGSSKLYECREHPRLLVSDHFDKKTRKSTRTFMVDNERCLNLEDAAFRLSNPPPFVEIADETPPEQPQSDLFGG